MTSAQSPDFPLSSTVDDTSARVNAIYRRHRDGVYRWALRYCQGDASWAEDVTQDVFVSLCRAIDRLDERDDLAGWLYRVTQNRCLTRLRRQTMMNAPAISWLIKGRTKSPEDVECLTANREGVRKVFEAVDRLPPKQRVAFCMYHLDGKEQAEIGAILGYSKSYICKLIARAEDRVRAQGWSMDHV